LTLAGSLSILLQDNWALTENLRKTKIEFGSGWYNKDNVKPQVIVSDLSSPVGQFFGTSTVTLHHRFVVNCWLIVPGGATGADEKTSIEDMRREVLRIINANRHGVNSLDIIVPSDEGTPHHELDATPRILRYEVTVFGVETRS